jgi:hypothetical protein
LEIDSLGKVSGELHCWKVEHMVEVKVCRVDPKCGLRATASSLTECSILDCHLNTDPEHEADVENGNMM